jgi:hypothetical protein
VPGAADDPGEAVLRRDPLLPAARAILALSHPLNPEHPPLGKEILALGIALFGDRPLGWRIMPALFGTLGLFAAMRAMWFASASRFATIACGVLLVTAFPLFVQSRIAMLDIFMASFALVALWMCAGAVREPETARWRLARPASRSASRWPRSGTRSRWRRCPGSRSSRCGCARRAGAR